MRPISHHRAGLDKFDEAGCLIALREYTHPIAKIVLYVSLNYEIAIERHLANNEPLSLEYKSDNKIEFGTYPAKEILFIQRIQE